MARVELNAWGCRLSLWQTKAADVVVAITPQKPPIAGLFLRSPVGLPVSSSPDPYPRPEVEVEGPIFAGKLHSPVEVAHRAEGGRLRGRIEVGKQENHITRASIRLAKRRIR